MLRNIVKNNQYRTISKIIKKTHDKNIKISRSEYIEKLAMNYYHNENDTRLISSLLFSKK